MLLGAAAAAALLAIRLFAIAAGSQFAPFSSWSRGARLGALLVVLAVLLGLAALLIRRPRRPLWFAGESGGALVLREAIEERLRRAVVDHADVLRAHVHVEVVDGRPRAEAEVAVRPLAEAAGLRDELAATVRELLERITGLEASRVEIRVHVIPVRRLRRYL